MKFLSFKVDGRTRYGWLYDDEQLIISPNTEDTDVPQSLFDFVRGAGDALQQLTNLQKKRQVQYFNIADIEYLEPIEPTAIICVGLNYSDHAEEVGKEKTKYPTIFFRLARSHVAHQKTLIVPKASDTLDWEGELAVVIGKGGRHIAADQALDHVFGYSIYNEGTVRKFQGHTSQFGLGKNFQASGAFGPVIVTADEFGDPYSHHLETRINDEIVQSASIDLMLHRIEDVIAYLSTAMPLQAGDMICTGTPAGVGLARKPRRFLQGGEVVNVTISGIGTLQTPVSNELP